MTKSFTNPATWKKSFFAGMLIGLASLIFLVIENRLIGALAFSMGLYYIVCNDLLLYTGKIGYYNKNASELLVILIGNLLGALATVYMVELAGIDVKETAWTILEGRMNVSIIGWFFRAFFCGVLIYIGVNTAKKGYILSGCVFAVFTFITSGFYHCIADMAYMGFSGFYRFNLFYLPVLIIGNSAGSLFANWLIQARSKKD